MKRVYFVRHGQTQTNVERLHGDPSDPLTEEGLKQAAFIAERVAKLPVEAFIASPYVRTRQTAEFIAKKLGKEPEYSDLFVESWFVSGFAGIPESDPETEQIFATIREGYGPGFKFRDEETYDDHTTRARAALDLLANRPEDQILVVTHGLFLKILIAHIIFDLKPTAQEIQKITWHLDTENTGITVFTYDPGRRTPWRLWIYNDHAHLG